jgi:hypothetical protein
VAIDTRMTCGITFSTLQRIRGRLKTLFCATWQPADDELFNLMTREGRQIDDVIHEDGAEDDEDANMVEC